MESRYLFGVESSAFCKASSVSGSINGVYKDRNKLNPVYQLTVGIIPLYKTCNIAFKPATSRPQRLLTNPSEGVSNNGYDNVDANLICRVGDKLLNSSGKVLLVLDALGTGTFGQVFRCQREDNKEIVAVKVIKNKPAYHSQGMLEIKIATLLNNTYDPNNEKHIVRLLDNFEYKQHICLVFELLSMSLLDVLTQNQFRGLPLSVVQRFTKQILTSMVALQDANIIHCDLKPENILLQPASTSTTTTKLRSDSIASSYGEESPIEAAKRPAMSDVKVIDFGSACFEGKTVYSYIQSRFYRSPEVLLGIPYNGAIDMWSLACVCAEMYLGLPLFPGVSQHNQLNRIVEMLGVPPDFLIEGKNGSKYFTTTQLNSPARLHHQQQQQLHSQQQRDILNVISGKYRIKTSEEYAHENNVEVPVLKKYLKYTHLDEVIMKCPLQNKAKMSIDQRHNEMMKRRSFLDFLQGLFNLNPFDRWTAQQAMSHPFILNMPFNGTPFQPTVDLKAKERKMMYIYQTKQSQVRPEDVGSLGQHGLRAPTNFGSSHDQFTLLQHRRLSEPLESNKLAVNNNNNNYFDNVNSNFTKFGRDKQSVQPVEVSSSSQAKTPVDSPMSSDSRPSLKRGNPVHINASYVEESPMERAMQQHQQHQQQQQQQQQHQKASPRGLHPPAALHYHVSQSYQPQGYGHQQQQLQLLQQQQQRQYANQQHYDSLPQQQQQYYQQINNNQPFSSSGSGAQSGQYHPQTSQLGFLIQEQQQHQQMYSQYSPNNAAAASYTASSMGVFGQGGSMQEAPLGMMMTDFGLALQRPDMDEHRRLMSQNSTAGAYSSSSHAAQSYAGGHHLQHQQHHHQQHSSHQYSTQQQSPRHAASQFSTAHSLDYNAGNMSRYALIQSAGGVGGVSSGSGMGMLNHVQPPLHIDNNYVGVRAGVELPSPVQQYSRSNSRRLHQNTSSNFAPSSSLSITIPTPLNIEPVQEPVLAYSFQNTDTSHSLTNSINYTSQWENSHIAASHASLSRSLGLNTIQQQQQLQNSKRESSDSTIKNSLDDYDELTDDSSPKVSCKSISTRNSESSDGGGGRSSSHDKTSNSNNNSNSSMNGANGAQSNIDGVKSASDALDNWDPFVDTED